MAYVLQAWRRQTGDGAFCLLPQVMLGATIGIARPSAVTWLNSDLFTVFLGFLMLSMGLTLTVEDFKKVQPLLTSGRCYVIVPASHLAMKG